MSDYFLCVVNDFTSLDQRYLDKLTRNLQNSNKPFREVRVSPVSATALLVGWSNRLGSRLTEPEDMRRVACMCAHR